MATKQTMVPLISSDVKGPLGAVQLPRLWSKVLLDAKGMLPEGYDVCGSGFDQMTLDGLGLDRERTLAYLKSEMPTYPQFEHWVVQQNGGHIAPDRISTLNASIAGYTHSDSTRKEILEGCGMQDDGTIKDAVTLNKLEDLQEFHSQLTAS